MVENEIIEKIENIETKEDKELDKQLSKVDLDESTNNIVNKIVEAKTTDELKKYIDLFNIDIYKKESLRQVKLQTLLDNVIDQDIKRFEKKPDEVSNKDILEHMKVVSDLIQKTREDIKNASTTPIVHLEKNEVNVNIGDNVIPRESKERVIEAVKKMLGEMEKAESKKEEVVEGEIKEAQTTQQEDIKQENVLNSNDEIKGENK